MSWVGPASRSGAKLAVRYGPHAMKAWDLLGDRAKEVARSKIDEVAARNAAFKDAEARVNGSVLRVSHHGQPVFVVFAADDPVAAYPETEEPLESLIDRVDLNRRITPAQRRERQLRARALRAGGQVARRAPRRGGAGPSRDRGEL